MYEAINSVDTSLAPSLSLDERMVLRCSERRDLFEEKFVDLENHNESTSSSVQGHGGAAGQKSKDDRSNHLGVPGGDADQQPRSRVGSDNSNASAVGLARTSKPSMSNSAKNKSLRDTHYFETSVYYNDLSLPIRLPLYTFPNEVGDVSLDVLHSVPKPQTDFA